MPNLKSKNLSKSLSVIITSQSSDNIVRLLESLISSFNKHLNIVLLLQSFELPLDSRNLLSEFPNLILKKIVKTSLSRARNIGSTIAYNNTLVFLDDDIQVKKPLEELILNNNSIYAFKIFRNDNGKGLIICEKGCPKKILKPNHWRHFMGGALLVKKDVFFELKGFNENLGVGTENGSGEETDFLFKAFSKGYIVGYIDDRIFDHPPIDLVSLTKMLSYSSGQGYMSAIEGPFKKRFYYCFIRPAMNHIISIAIPVNNHSRKTNRLLLKALIKGVLKL